MQSRLHVRSETVLEGMLRMFRFLNLTWGGWAHINECAYLWQSVTRVINIDGMTDAFFPLQTSSRYINVPVALCKHNFINSWAETINAECISLLRTTRYDIITLWFPDVALWGWKSELGTNTTKMILILICRSWYFSPFRLWSVVVSSTYPNISLAIE